MTASDEDCPPAGLAFWLFRGILVVVYRIAIQCTQRVPIEGCECLPQLHVLIKDRAAVEFVGVWSSSDRVQSSSDRAAIG